MTHLQASQYQATQLVYYIIIFLVYATVGGINVMVLMHLREKGKTHYRAWLVPGLAGNAVGVVLSLVALGHFLLHIRPTPTYYYISWAGYGVLSFFAVYVAARLWQSVKNAPTVSAALPQRDPSGSPPGVWPPPPR